MVTEQPNMSAVGVVLVDTIALPFKRYLLGTRLRAIEEATWVSVVSSYSIR